MVFVLRDVNHKYLIIGSVTLVVVVVVVVVAVVILLSSSCKGLLLHLINQ